MICLSHLSIVYIIQLNDDKKLATRTRCVVAGMLAEQRSLSVPSLPAVYKLIILLTVLIYTVINYSDNVAECGPMVKFLAEVHADPSVTLKTCT